MFSIGKFNLFIGILISLLFMSSVAVAQDDSVRKELEAVYAKRDQALKAKDVSLTKSLLADDYTQKDKDGKIMNRAETIAEWERNAADKDLKEVSNSTKIQSVKQGKDGNEMIVDTSQTLKMTGMMEGQLHQLEVNGKYRDTWVRADAGWKLRYSEMLDASMTEVEAAWIKYTSSEGRYSGSFPGQPKLETDEGQPKSYRATSMSLPAVFTVGYFDLGANQTFSVDDFLKGQINQSATILASNPINVGGYPGNQLVKLQKDSSGETITDIRVSKVGGRVYLIIFGYPKDAESDAMKAKGAKFFDSFLISK